MSAINKQIERQGGNLSPLTAYYPKVRAGICDRCGVLDPNVEGVHQYKLCEHYRGKQLMCSYCPSSTNPDEVIARAVLEVYDHPQYPNQLVVVCDTSTCVDKHYKRWQPSA